MCRSFHAGADDNDIFMLQRATLIYLQSPPEEQDPVSYARVSTALMFAKLLAGKLHEACIFLTTVPAHSKLVRAYDNDLDVEAKHALAQIKAFFNKPNTFERVRNKVAFHYELGPMREAYAAYPVGEAFRDYFAEAETNSFYQGAAQLAAFAALGVSRKEELKPALERLLDEVLEVSRWVKDYAHGFMEVFLRRHVNSDLGELLSREIVVLKGVPRLADVRAPYFCSASKHDLDVNGGSSGS